MLKLFTILLLASCATQTPEKPVAAPAAPAKAESVTPKTQNSIFMNTFNVPGGRAALDKIIDEYSEDVAKNILQAKNPTQVWFKNCGKKVPKQFSAKDAFECHDKFASQYFMDINFITISRTFEESDMNTILNNFSMYPVAVINHYRKIAETLPE